MSLRLFTMEISLIRTNSLLKRSFSQIQMERNERLYSDIQKANTNRAIAETTRTKFQYSEPRLSNPKPTQYFIQKAKETSEERQKKRLQATRSSLKMRPSRSNFSLSSRSKSVTKTIERSHEDHSPEAVRKYTSDESIQKMFPRWLLTDSEFVARVKELSSTSQTQIADTCAKPTKYRTSIEKEGLHSYISSLEFFKPMPSGVVRKACEKMKTTQFEEGETRKP